MRSNAGNAVFHAWVLMGFMAMPLVGVPVAAAVAQRPDPIYERQASWAETIVQLRDRARRRPQLYRSPTAFRPMRPNPMRPNPMRPNPMRATAPHPLLSLWEQLERDFPLECDWLMQDLAACGYLSDNPAQTGQYPLRWFGPWIDADLESKLIEHVIEELGPAGREHVAAWKRLRRLDTPPHSAPWMDLYAQICRQRRTKRLKALSAKCSAFVFTKHFNMGGSHYAFTEGLSDAQSERHFEPGSSLCLLEMKGGEPRVSTLLDDPHGVIRDPDVAYEADRVLFSWKKSYRQDDYHLYELDLASGSVRQLTFGLGYADYEGVYLPDGNLLFNSTRCIQVVDCFFTEVSNLYTCDADGQFLRRVAYDQVHSNYPTVTHDGRVLYTRWEYNDRGQIFTQSLFQMNPDGTSQVECYGNNSYFPTAILHARRIPASSKVVAVAAGHHTPQMGKLLLLDPARGSQENHGAQLIAPIRETPAVKVDRYGQRGALWQYPYPLSESEFLVSLSPWGQAREPLRFAIYYQTSDGGRELLVHDVDVSCNQPVPLRRPVPHRRPRVTDYTYESGTFYIQDVYAGPGLDGVPRGTAKKIRVVGLAYRPTAIGGNHNRGEAGQAYVCTPVSIAQGSWEVKKVIGETPVYSDGSAFFSAPARTPLYFQVIDDQGCVIQTMRSWTLLQPGENAACVGCHEQKAESPQTIPTAEALRRGPRELDSFYGSVRGFSFPKEIQPILDRHCVNCHNDRSRLAWVADRVTNRGTVNNRDPKTAFSLLADTTVDQAAKRHFSDSYLSLAGAVRGYDGAFEGRSRPLVNWVSPQSGPPMRKPYSSGSATSGLMSLLRENHHGVQLNREELEKIACWIDLVIPYCGDYWEANSWSLFERNRYEYYYRKRRSMENLEELNIRKLIADQSTAGSSSARKTGWATNPPAAPLRVAGHDILVGQAGSTSLSDR